MNKKSFGKIFGFVIAFLVFFVLLIFMIASFSYPKASLATTDHPVNIEWYCADNDLESPVRLPHNFNAKANQVYTIKAHLPNDCENINTLVYRSSQQGVEIKIEDEVIYTYDTDDFRPFGKANPSKWNIVNLPKNIEGKTISISICSPYENFSGNFNQVEIGDGAKIISGIVKKHTYYFVTSFVLLLASFFMFVSSFFFIKKNVETKKIRYIAICAFFSATWMLSEAKMINTPISEFATYQIAFLSLYMISITFSLFLMMECPKKIRKYVTFLFVLSLADFFVSSLLHIFNIRDFFQTSLTTAIILSLELILYVVNFINQQGKTLNKNYARIEFVGLIALLISFVIEYFLFFPNSFGNTGMFLNIGLSIFIISLYSTALLNLIYQANLSMEYESQLKEAKNYLILSQMKPHFIYNTLGAIRTMIISSPQTAYNMVTHFSKYLRANINTVDPNEQILFSKELEHINAYVEIEKIRFKDRIRVEYSIEQDQFLVPPLTIQPLVENAIKHGICKKN